MMFACVVVFLVFVLSQKKIQRKKKLRLTEFYFSGIRRNMRLREWLTLQKRKQNEFATEVKVSAAHLSRIARGEIYPAATIVERIVAATSGRVTPNDLFDEWKERAGTASINTGDTG